MAPHWPLKPDVVLEGGNAAKDSLSAVAMPSLSLLTTHYRPVKRLFTTANATSAATALASRLAAQVMAIYPHLWPETIRALIVHSAEWTKAMKDMFLPRTGSPQKQDYSKLLRRCGFGVPDIDRALWSVENSLTMVIEESLHPFMRVTGRQPTLRDMHLHSLPWPHDVLESLGETPVEMRVTLSYFIEPNPSRRGARSRYRYESHGFRFDVKRPLESTDEFRKRINLAARDEDEGTRRSGDDSCGSSGHRGATEVRCTETSGGNRSGSRQPRQYRSLSHGGLVEDAPRTRKVRSNSTVCPCRQHQGARGRRGSLYRGSQSDCCSGQHRDLKCTSASPTPSSTASPS